MGGAVGSLHTHCFLACALKVKRGPRTNHSAANHGVCRHWFTIYIQIDSVAPGRSALPYFQDPNTPPSCAVPGRGSSGLARFDYLLNPVEP